YLEGDPVIELGDAPALGGKPATVAHVGFKQRHQSTAGDKGAMIVVFRVHTKGAPWRYLDEAGSHKSHAEQDEDELGDLASSGAVMARMRRICIAQVLAAVGVAALVRDGRRNALRLAGVLAAVCLVPQVAMGLFSMVHLIAALIAFPALLIWLAAIVRPTVL